MKFFAKYSFEGNVFPYLVRYLKYIGICLVFFLISEFSLGQDATFSQYYSAGLYLNPAFAGIESRVTINSNYRNQWKSLGVPYTTSQFSIIAPISFNKATSGHIGGVGLSVFNNNAGDGNLNTTGVNLNFGYNVHLSYLHYLSFGVQGGFIQKSISLDNLTWGSQYNPFIGGFEPNTNINTDNIAPKRIFPDFGAGLMYYFNPERDYQDNGLSAYAGFSAYHISSPNESLVNGTKSNIPRLFKFHAGFEKNLSHRFNVSPNVLVAHQNGVNQINGGAYLTWLFSDNISAISPGLFIIGTWYRVKDSFIFSTGIGNNNYVLGFSYDLNNSSLRYNTRGKGAYEFSLKIQFGSQKSVKIYNPLI